MIKSFLMNDKRDYTCMFLQIKKFKKKKMAVYRATWDR